MDWVKFLISAVVGLVSILLWRTMFAEPFLSFLLSHVNLFSHLTQMCLPCLSSYQVAVVSSLEMPKADLWVMIAVLSTVIGYCAKTYFT